MLGRSHVDFERTQCTHALPHGLQSFGLIVLEVKNPRSEFRLEIKILLYKSTLGNTNLASELKSNIKQNIFISKNYEILDLRKKSKILLIKMFYLTLDFNSDVIFVFLRVDLHNKILISSKNFDLEKLASSNTARLKFQRPLGRARVHLARSKSTCDHLTMSHSLGNRPQPILRLFIFSANPSSLPI